MIRKLKTTQKAEDEDENCLVLTSMNESVLRMFFGYHSIDYETLNAVNKAEQGIYEYMTA